ncbi:unnamed protein product, partial [marine sediment metagenome]
MNDMFSDEVEEENIFDKEKEDEKPATDESIELAEMGIDSSKLNGLKQKYPSKKIISRKQITKFAFRWVLDRCSLEELEGIVKSKLSAGLTEMLVAKFNELEGNEMEDIEDTEEIEEIEVPQVPLTGEESLVSRYIKKNGALEREKIKLQEKLSKKTVFAQGLIEKLAWLYKFMDKMNFFDLEQFQEFINN